MEMCSTLEAKLLPSLLGFVLGSPSSFHNINLKSSSPYEFPHKRKATTHISSLDPLKAQST
jgi:hypothetical protein